MLSFVAGLLSFVVVTTAPLAIAFGDWLIAGPLLPWLLVPAGLGLAGFLLLGLFTILDG